MKSPDNSSALKSTIQKKTIKPLNQKKNSTLLQNTLHTQSNKSKLLNIDTSQTNLIKNDRLGSPKTNISQYTVGNNKSQINDDFFKSQKSQLKKVSNLNKVKKLSKHQPIKKQTFAGLKSPKSNKLNTVQSEICLGTQRQKISFNEESNLNIELDTSIAGKLHDFIEQKPFNQVILAQSQKNIPLSIYQIQISQLTKTSNQQKQQIQRLKQQNQQLERKLNKLKLNQQQNRKKLRERISNFNEEGEETKLLKDRISQLEQQVVKLEEENRNLKNKQIKEVQNVDLNLQIEQKLKKLQQNLQKNAKQINLNLTNLYSLNILPEPRQLNKKQSAKTSIQMIDQSVMTSFQQSSYDPILSQNNDMGLNNSQSSIISSNLSQKIKQFSYNQVSPTIINPNFFQIQLIKSSYQEKYKAKFQQLNSLYEENFNDVKNRYKVLVEEIKQTIKAQEREILSLENKMDQIYQKYEDCTCHCNKTGKKSVKMNLQTDQEKLKLNMIILSNKNKICSLQETVKQCHQDLRTKQIQCKKYMAQLDIQRMKYNFNTQSGLIKKQLIKFVQNEQYSLMKQQLKQQKQKYQKIMLMNQKKQQLIKKLTAYHQNSGHSNNSNKKKLRK